MRKYGMPKGFIETKLGKFRWVLYNGHTVVISNEETIASNEQDYLTGGQVQVEAWAGSKVNIRGVAYLAYVTLQLNGNQWTIEDTTVTRNEQKPIGKGVEEQIGTVLLEDWRKFIALNPALPHLAQRYFLSRKLEATREECERLATELRTTHQLREGFEAELKEAEGLVLDTVNEVQKPLLDSAFT